MKKAYKPLGEFLTQTEELKKLISEHPDYPIVVTVGYEVVGSDDFRSWYAPELSFSIGEILDCEQDINDEIIYTDRGTFRDDVEYLLSDEYCDLSDEEYEMKVQEKLKEYEPYWKNVIVIHADV